MSLQSIAQSLHDLKPLDSNRLLVGIVVDNNDPTKKQRIRVQIPGVLEGEDTSLLPWMAPRHMSPYGIGDDFGVQRIPRIGSRVYVSFQDGDGSFGEYLADVVSASVTPPDELLTNYPNRVGMFTPLGDLMYLDMTSGDMMMRRVSGTSVKIDGAGNMVVVCAGNFTHTIKGNYTLVVEGDSTQMCSGNLTSTVSGDAGLLVEGSDFKTVSGDQTIAVTGSRSITCADESHAGVITNLDDVIGEGISLSGHKHSGVDTGNGNTEPPIP